MYIIAVYNLKGGVGKTTTAVNLAHTAASQGYKTVLWDLDPQGAASWYLDAANPEVKTKKLLSGRQPIGSFLQETKYKNLLLIPASLSQRHSDIILDKYDIDERSFSSLVDPLGETNEVLIIDCPPSFSRLAERLIQVSELVLTPVIPSHLSLNTYESMLKLFRKKGFDTGKLHVLFSLVDLRRQLHRQLLLQPPEQMKHVFRTYIPYNSMIEKMGVEQAPFPAYARAAQNRYIYEDLLDEVMDAIRDNRPDLSNYPAARLFTGTMS